MGSRREASQASRGRSISGPEGVFDQQEKEPEEQQGLIRALTGTLHHFFGGFSPSIRPGYRPPRSSEDPLSPRESCLRRCHDVPVSPQSETTDWVVTAQRSLGHQIPRPLWSGVFSSWRYPGNHLFESKDRPDSDGFSCSLLPGSPLLNNLLHGYSSLHHPLTLHCWHFSIDIDSYQG